MSNKQIAGITTKKDISIPKLKYERNKQKQPIVHELDRNVLSVLKREGPITRAKLVSLTGVARSTLYDSLMRLNLKGYVTSFSEERKQRGRPKVFYEAVQ